jgi:hypothetical protein
MQAPIAYGTVSITYNLSPPQIATMSTTTVSGLTSTFNATTGEWQVINAVKTDASTFLNIILQPTSKLPGTGTLTINAVDSFGSQVSGVKTIVFNPGPWAPDLGVPDIAIAQGKSVVIDETLFPLTIYNNVPPDQVNNYFTPQNCEVQLVSTGAVVSAPAQVTVADEIAGTYELVNTGSAEPMSLTWSASIENITSAEQTVKITLLPWPITAVKQLTVANGGFVILDSSNYLAVNPSNPTDYASVNLMQGTTISHGWLVWAKTGANLTVTDVVTQATINSTQLGFQHDGSNQIPALSFISEIDYGNGSDASKVATAPEEALGVTFIPDQMPDLTQNQEVITDDGITINLDARNNNQGGSSDALTFSFSDVTGGQLLNKVTNQAVSSASYASAQANNIVGQNSPGETLNFSTQVCTPFTCSAKQAVTKIDNRQNLGAIVGGIVGGAAALAGILALGIIAGTRAQKRKELLQHLRQSSRSNSAWKLAADLYVALNLNYIGIDSTEVTEYIATIESLCEQFSAGKSQTIEVEQITQGNGREELAASIAWVLKTSDELYVKTTPCAGNSLRLKLIENNKADIAERVKIRYFGGSESPSPIAVSLNEV